MTAGACALEVRDLTVRVSGRELLHRVSFTLEPGERLGFIGGSGSGKTLTALAITGLLPREAEASGSVRLDGTELLGLTERERAGTLGDRIGMVFQEPRTALSPFRRLGAQMTDALAIHYRLSRHERRAAALRLAAAVGLDAPERMLRAYPHEVSGGQLQRAAIAAAISARPGLLIADEPTTALDVSVQRGILDLFVRSAAPEECSLICITHDFAVLSRVAERVVVFDGGRVVEAGRTADVLAHPAAETTRALVAAAAGGAA